MKLDFDARPAEQKTVSFPRQDSGIRAPSTIYGDTLIGENFTTGHYVLIRENCTIGDDVSIGSFCDIENAVIIGDRVRIHSRCFLPALTVIEDDVWIGPCVTFCNDKYPNSLDPQREGVTVRRGAVIGAAAVILPGVTIGEDAIVGAGAVVTRDVLPGATVVGNPARTIKIGDRQNCDEAL